MRQRPSDPKPAWAPDEAVVDTPSSGKQNTGFAMFEKLGSKILNWFMKRTSSWLQWTEEQFLNMEPQADIYITDVDTETQFDDTIAWLNSIHKNDYFIEIRGTYDWSGKTVELSGIGGSGSIMFFGTTEVRRPDKIILRDMGCSVQIGGTLELTVTDSVRNCIDISNSVLTAKIAATVDSGASGNKLVGTVGTGSRLYLPAGSTVVGNVNVNYGFLVRGHLVVDGTTFSAFKIACIYVASTGFSDGHYSEYNYPAVFTGSCVGIRAERYYWDQVWTMTSANAQYVAEILTNIKVLNSRIVINCTGLLLPGYTVINRLSGGGRLTFNNFTAGAIGSTFTNLRIAGCTPTLEFSGTMTVANITNEGFAAKIIEIVDTNQLIINSLSTDIRTTGNTSHSGLHLENIGNFKLNEWTIPSNSSYAPTTRDMSPKYMKLVNANGILGLLTHNPSWATTPHYIAQLSGSRLNVINRASKVVGGTQLFLFMPESSMLVKRTSTSSPDNVHSIAVNTSDAEIV